MSKKLYEHIISVNYAKVSERIKKEKKKSKPRDVSTSSDSGIA